MKRATTTNRNPLENQGRNLPHAEWQDQSIVENNLTGENLPRPIMRLVYSAEEPVQITGSPDRTKLYIKNMVSIRCKMVVKSVLENLKLNYSTVQLGEVEIIGNLSEPAQEQLKSELLKYGLELMEDKNTILVKKTINVIVEMIHYLDEQPKIHFSDYLSRKLNHSYTYISKLFSEVKGISIQHFILSHKIERVKELLIYDELSLSEIAWKLQYSSVAHLSNQFKKATGLTLSHFKNMNTKRRRTLDTNYQNK